MVSVHSEDAHDIIGNLSSFEDGYRQGLSEYARSWPLPLGHSSLIQAPNARD